MNYSNRKAIAVGVAVTLALIMVNPSISPISALNEKTCSTILGFKYYDSLGIAESVKSSQMMLIATVSNTDTRVSQDGEEMGVPWKFVMLEVEKYLFDKTGKYSKYITVRAPANECVDSFGILSRYHEYEPG